MYHPPFKDYAEDRTEQGVPKHHFIERRPFCGFCLLIGAVIAWAIIFGLRWAASLLLVAVAVTISYVGLGVIASLLLASGAYAHDALPTAAKPNGWSYPFSCCSGYDCREVADAAISERPEGYVINGTGEVLGYRDARIKESPDGRVHWCSVAGADDGRTICLFIPPRSY